MTAVAIQFQAEPYLLKGQMLLRLPHEASEKLSSRGQVAVMGAVNNYDFTTVLEPDGDWGHWLRIDQALQKAASMAVGDAATLVIAQTKDWPEPAVPQDVTQALAASPKEVQLLWRAITPMARWEWVRWVNATSVAATRRRRVEVTILKLQSGKRRPCCFNLAACTDPLVSRGGKLLGLA